MQDNRISYKKFKKIKYLLYIQTFYVNILSLLYFKQFFKFKCKANRPKFQKIKIKKKEGMFYSKFIKPKE